MSRLHWILGVAGLAGLAVLPATDSRQWIYTLTVAAITAIAVSGLNLLIGYAGLVSFATPSFMAVGGYGCVLVPEYLHTGQWVSIAISVIVAVVLARIIARPLVRLRGHYLAFATFAISLAVIALIGAAKDVTGGAIGLSDVEPLTLPGVDLADPKVFYVFAWVLCLLVTTGVATATRSRVGRAWRAIATDERVATSLAVDGRRYKTLAFAIAGGLAALSGAIYVEFLLYVSPDYYGTTASIQILIMLFLGGVGSIIGPLVGAVVVLGAPILIGGLEEYQEIVFAACLLLVLVLRPQGLTGRVVGAGAGKPRTSRWGRRASRPATTRAT